MSTLLSRIDGSTLLAIAGGRSRIQIAIADSFGDMLPEACTAFQIDTPLRLEHFLAQTAHESDAFRTVVEYATGQAYEGRKDLGNVNAGDGVRYKGRGPIQLTGRSNYRAFTNWMRKVKPSCPDFEAQPDWVAQFPWAGWAAVYFWSVNGLNSLADKDDLVAITLKINGGRNGLASRSKYLARAKTVIGTLVADLVSREQQFAVLRRGMSGSSIEDLQRGLTAAGVYHLTIDGFFGPGTEQAIRAFQKASGLTVDGVAGAKTIGALRDRKFLN
ncbi:peptidoglycan-binding protein [Rhizobium sp. 11_C7_N12_5]|uniref:peptidoglycan-binding protein n=1 Tax=Rhizobium sp. 11_C7_N12_5 TaxID=3240770 RepID=UPI003F263D47